MGNYRLGQPKGQMSLRCYCNVFFACRESGASTRAGTDGTPNQCAFAAAGECANQCARSRAATNKCPVSLLMRVCLYKDTGGMQRHRLPAQVQRDQGNTQISWIMQPP